MPHSPAKVFKTFYLEMQSWAAHPAVQGGSLGCPWQDGVPLMPGQQCGQSSCSGQRQLPATAADRAGRRIFCSMEAADVRLQLCFWVQAAVGVLAVQMVSLCCSLKASPYHQSH